MMYIVGYHLIKPGILYCSSFHSHGLISEQCKNIADMQPMLLEQIAHFFEHYKDLDEGKWVRVEGWGGVEEAKAEIMASIELYRAAPVKPQF